MSPAALGKFTQVKDMIAKLYGKDPAKMLIHTGVIGWILSSAAQVVAIAINDKIPKEQKMFLIPQEISDAGVNIVSFYLVTQGFKSVASKLVKSGKWLPKNVHDFLVGKNFANKLGKADFRIGKNVKLPDDIEKSYTSFKKGIDVIATTIGSILSCNIITPIVRNEIAANRQKSLVNKMNTSNKQNPLDTNNNFPKLKNYSCMKDFQTLSFNSYSNPSLKI